VTVVHALGLLLTELLTDEPPFSADPRRAAVRADHVGPRPDPEQQGRERRGLEKIVARALALSPGQRWKDAGQLLAAVDARAGRAAPAPRVRAASSAPIGDDGERAAGVAAVAAGAGDLAWCDARAISAYRCRVGWRFCPCSPCWCGRWDLVDRARAAVRRASRRRPTFRRGSSRSRPARPRPQSAV
jgi:hypothetical protein